MLQICPPNIPTRRIKCAVINYEFFDLLAPLMEKLGITCIPSEKNDFISPYICGHADLQFCILPNKTALIDKRLHELSGSLKSKGFRILNSGETLKSEYPNDCLFNVAIIDNIAILNIKTCAKEIIYELKRNKFELIDVNQGYTRCSVAIVSKNAIITADDMIAKRCMKYGLDVLTITSGGIDLNGYEYGFIGGCCGLVSPNEMVFTGNLDSHPDKAQIENFLEKYSVKVICLTDCSVFDIGGIIPLLE